MVTFEVLMPAIYSARPSTHTQTHLKKNQKTEQNWNHKNKIPQTNIQKPKSQNERKTWNRKEQTKSRIIPLE